MTDRMSDEEFGVLYHVELPKWQEELGDPNLDKFADEARRAREERDADHDVLRNFFGDFSIAHPIGRAITTIEQLRARLAELEVGDE